MRRVRRAPEVTRRGPNGGFSKDHRGDTLPLSETLAVSVDGATPPRPWRGGQRNQRLDDLDHNRDALVAFLATRRSRPLCTSRSRRTTSGNVARNGGRLLTIDTRLLGRIVSAVTQSMAQWRRGAVIARRPGKRQDDSDEVSGGTNALCSGDEDRIVGVRSRNPRARRCCPERANRARTCHPRRVRPGPCLATLSAPVSGGGRTPPRRSLKRAVSTRGVKRADTDSVGSEHRQEHRG